MKSVSPLFVAFILYGFMTCESTDVTTSATTSQKIIQDVEFGARNHTHDRKVAFECHNTTLGSSKFEIFPNGTLHVQTRNLMLNTSAYIQVDDTVTICAPVEEEGSVYDKRFYKAIYFSLLTFIFQLQVPVVACLSRNFNRMAPALLVSFFGCLVSAYYIVPVDLWMEKPAFFSLWFSVPSILNFIALTSIAWMNLLSSDLVVNYLKCLDHITVKGNVIVIKQVGGILRLSLFLGFGIAVVTFVMIHSGMIENYTGLPREFDSLAKMLPFFFPSVLILTSFNVCFFGIGRAFPLRTFNNDKFWLRLHEKNCVFLHLHIFAVANWILGCLIVIGDMWWVWNLFASMSIMVPVLILRAAWVPKERAQQIIAEKFAANISDGQSPLLTIKIDNPVWSI